MEDESLSPRKKLLLVLSRSCDWYRLIILTLSRGIDKSFSEKIGLNDECDWSPRNLETRSEENPILLFLLLPHADSVILTPFSSSLNTYASVRCVRSTRLYSIILILRTVVRFRRTFTLIPIYWLHCILLVSRRDLISFSFRCERRASTGREKLRLLMNKCGVSPSRDRDFLLGDKMFNDFCPLFRVSPLDCRIHFPSVCQRECKKRDEIWIPSTKNSHEMPGTQWDQETSRKANKERPGKARARGGLSVSRARFRRHGTFRLWWNCVCQWYWLKLV